MTVTKISQSKIDEMDEAFDAELNASAVDDDLPCPVGWRLLVKLIEVEAVSAGGIVLVDETKQLQEHRSSIGLVVKVGQECYQHSKFMTAWAKVGDYVAYKPYAGARIDIKNAEGKYEKYRFLNDDEILAVVPDPSKVKAYL